jgi:hypothetical protein
MRIYPYNPASSENLKAMAKVSREDLTHHDIGNLSSISGERLLEFIHITLAQEPPNTDMAVVAATICATRQGDLAYGEVDVLEEARDLVFPNFGRDIVHGNPSSSGQQR